MAIKHGELVNLHERISPIDLHNPLNMRSRDKEKTLYLHYHNAYVHQTYQDGDILSGAPTNIFA